MGLYPGDPGPPGADCGATVLGLGDTVTHLRLAEDVFGESPGCGENSVGGWVIIWINGWVGGFYIRIPVL